MAGQWKPFGLEAKLLFTVCELVATKKVATEGASDNTIAIGKRITTY